MPASEELEVKDALLAVESAAFVSANFFANSSLLTGLKDLAPNTPDDEVAVVEVNAEGLAAVETVEVKDEVLVAAVEAAEAVAAIDEVKADGRVAAPADEDGCAVVPKANGLAAVVDVAVKAEGLAVVAVATDVADALGAVPKVEGLAMDEPAAEAVEALAGAGGTGLGDKAAGRAAVALLTEVKGTVLL